MRKFLLILFTISVALTACGQTTNSDDEQTIVLYSGRSESLVGPIIEQFTAETGIAVQVRYGGTAELAATLLEEGDNSPADVFWAQDPGGLGAIADAGLLAVLPDDVLNTVSADFRSPAGMWVGISGRARTVVYNTETLAPEDLPDDLMGFTDPQWAGKIGWAPTNGSFQVMVTGMREVWGDAQTREWLTGILVNSPIDYPKNTPIVAAVGAGEIEVGFVNHYYLYRFLAEEGESFPARNYFLPAGGPGSLVMVSGAGVLQNSAKVAAVDFLRYLLAAPAQQYFANETYEYPLLAGVTLYEGLLPLDQINVLDVRLAALADLQGTIALLSEVGALP